MNSSLTTSSLKQQVAQAKKYETLLRYLLIIGVGKNITNQNILPETVIDVYLLPP